MHDTPLGSSADLASSEVAVSGPPRRVELTRDQSRTHSEPHALAYAVLRVSRAARTRRPRGL